MKKISNKILIIVLTGLVAVFVLSRLFRAPHLEGNMPSDLISVDTSNVDRITIDKMDTTGSSSITLQKKADGWYVTAGSQTALADKSSISGLLSTTTSLKPERIVTRKKAGWSNYDVGDSSVHVEIKKGDQVLAAFHVGRTEFSRSANGMGGATSYLRLDGNDDVYAVDGFLQSLMSRSFPGWRSKLFLRTQPDDITKFIFSYPADSGFVLEKHDSLWWIGTSQVDKGKIQQYLNTWRSRNLYTFAADTVKTGKVDATIRAQGLSKDIEVVQAWKTAPDEWVLKSTSQSDALFTAKDNSITRDVLVGKKFFLGN